MILFRSRGALFGECWFDDDVPPPDCAIDVLALRQRSAPVPRGRCTASWTLISDLAVEADRLLAAFGDNCRQKISRAERRDELCLELSMTPRARLDEFCDFYDAFATQKSLRPADRNWLEGACEAGRLALTTAWRGGEPLVRHGYVIGADTARLQYSASLFRGRSNDERALTARANRWLHWRSMLGFQQRGLACYDWGGLFEEESTAERAGINRFKKEFGGQAVRRFDCFAARSARGRVRLGARRLADGWRFIGARVATLRSPRAVPGRTASAAESRSTGGADA